MDSIGFVSLSEGITRLHGKRGTSLECDIRRAVAESRWALGLKHGSSVRRTEWKAVGKHPKFFPATLIPFQKKRECPVTKVGEVHVSMVSELTPIFNVKSPLPKATEWATRHTCSIERCCQPGQSWRKVILRTQGPMHFSSISVGHWYKLLI